MVTMVDIIVHVFYHSLKNEDKNRPTKHHPGQSIRDSSSSRAESGPNPAPRLTPGAKDGFYGSIFAMDGVAGNADFEPQLSKTFLPEQTLPSSFS